MSEHRLPKLGEEHLPFSMVVFGERLTIESQFPYPLIVNRLHVIRFETPQQRWQYFTSKYSTTVCVELEYPTADTIGREIMGKPWRQIQEEARGGAHGL